jgi:NADH-quinone oxidoreductase subunit N
MSGYALIAPELLLLVAVLWGMFADRLPGGDRGAAWVGTGLAAAAGVAASLAPVGAQLFGGLLVFDGPARFARTGVAVIAALWLLWTAGRAEGRVREAVVLACLSTIGALLMSASRELITLVLAIELATMPAYVLIGYRRKRVEGLEGALKYFLLSMLTSLVMLYGMSFLYGVTGTTRLAEFDLTGTGTLGLLAVVLTFVGLFAKLSAAPFHYWAPDAYEGSEAWPVAFVSVVPKVAGAVAVVRLTAALAPSAPQIGPALVAVAAASMVLGNLAALTQTDVRRLMAYSGVAHTGYLLLGAGALSAAGLGSAVFYALAYALPSLGVVLIAAEEGPAIADFDGLFARRPATAWAVVVMLVSLIGIPPLVGFFGKLYLFAAALEAGLAGWVVLALLMSVVSAAYYLRIVRAMFFGERTTGREAVRGPIAASVAIAVTTALVVALGLAAGPLLAALGSPLP